MVCLICIFAAKSRKQKQHLCRSFGAAFIVYYYVLRLSLQEKQVRHIRISSRILLFFLRLHVYPK